MSESPQVDLSQIRGDWYFHMNFLERGMESVLARAVKLLDEVKADVDPGLSSLAHEVADGWKALAKNRGPKDSFDVAQAGLDDFLKLLASTKKPFDEFEEAKGLGGSASTYDSKLEHFTEAMRQARSYNDDFIMMREQKP